MLGNKTKEELLDFKRGRRNVVWALERLAMFEDHFFPSAELLLKLAVAENEEWANNATGVFKSLFSLGVSKVATTETHPKKRLKFIKQIFKSGTNEERKIVIEAFEDALESEHLVRMSGVEVVGLRDKPKRWTPETYGDWYEEYRRYWRFLVDHITDLNEQEQERATEILMSKVGGLLRKEYFSDELIDDLESMLEDETLDEKDVLKKVNNLLRHSESDLKDSTISRLKDLKENLVGDDFESRLKRYVGTRWIEDEYDHDGNRTEKVDNEIQRLSKEIYKNPNLLTEKLSWLKTEEAKRAAKLGSHLALKDEDRNFLDTIVRNYSEEDSKANISLLTGYLHRIFQDDPDEWESILGDLFENDYFQKRFHELVQYSGVSDWSIQKVKELVDEEVLEIDVLNEFAYGGKPERISRKKFDEILGFLSKENTTESIEVALELLFFRVCMSEKEADVKTARNLLVNEKVFGRIDENRQAAIDKDRWSDLTLWYISSAEEGEEWVFLRMLFENIENCSTTGFLYFDEMIFPLLKELCGQNKHKVWNIIKEFLEFPLDIRGQILKKCISGAGSSFQNTDPLIDYLDWNDVEMWLEEGDSERAVKFVSFLPNRLFEPNGRMQDETQRFYKGGFK
jgi:hypothetical protein